MEDMKIRGAGEILGDKQHGTIETFGYDLYIKMLNEEICRQKGEFVEKIENAGILELDEEIEPVVIKEPVIFSDEKAGKYVMALPYDGFKISYTIDFNHSFLKSQYYELEVNLENYVENIAKCRTFFILQIFV